MTRQHIVFLTGAGISAESGIPTYRGEGGLWNDHETVLLSSVARFEEDPDASLEHYNKLRSLIANAQPNAAYKAIAELEQWHDVTVLTQNVDDLHERAGSSHVIHLHGRLNQVTSSFNRLDSDCIQDYPLDVPIKVGDKAADGSQLRPAIVMFDEYVDLSQAVRIAKEADVFVIVGSSITLSAAKTLSKCPRMDIPRYVIDPENVKSRLPKGFKWIKASATKGMGLFLDEVQKGFPSFTWPPQKVERQYRVWSEESFIDIPYTINDVIDILRAEGFSPEILHAPEEDTVCFKLDGVPIYVYSGHIPSLIFELTFPLNNRKIPLDMRFKAAYDATKDSFLAKVIVYPEAYKGYDLVSAQAECIADSKGHIADNLDRYINILKAAMGRYIDNIRRLQTHPKKP